MKEKLRIVCPNLAETKKQRITDLFVCMERWVDSDALGSLVELFGGKSYSSLAFREKLHFLNQFADVWDYRKKLANGGERWNIYDDAFVENNSDKIMECIARLGLKDITTPIILPDYILPLGGARMTNLIRPQYAAELSSTINKEHKIVALGGIRPISDIERPYTDTYAPDALTEYQAICSGMEEAFHIVGKKYFEKVHKEDNLHSNWAIRQYEDTELYVVAAPSSVPSRRANSIDTFEFFSDNFHLVHGEKILLVTSCIYVPFQLLKFMKIAIENNLMIDCVGTPYISNNVLKPSNYLQEIKATINAMQDLVDYYSLG